MPRQLSACHSAAASSVTSIQTWHHNMSTLFPHYRTQVARSPPPPMHQVRDAVMSDNNPPPPRDLNATLNATSAAEPTTHQDRPWWHEKDRSAQPPPGGSPIPAAPTSPVPAGAGARVSIADHGVSEGGFYGPGGVDVGGGGGDGRYGLGGAAASNNGHGINLTNAPAGSASGSPGAWDWGARRRRRAIYIGIVVGVVVLLAIVLGATSPLYTRGNGR